MRILHITDTHLLGAGLHYDQVDTAGLLAEVIDHARSIPRCDLIVVAGDVSEDGTAESYVVAHEIIAPLAGEWGAGLVWAAGNHDQRTPMRQALGIDGTGSEPVRTVGAGIIAADTSVPRAGWGLLGESIEWLEAELANQPGAVLVMHHPPLVPPTTLHSALRLVDAPRLAQMLERHPSPPRVILSGHYHLPVRGEVAGIPVVVGAAVANLTDVRHGVDTESAVPASGYTLVEVNGSGVNSRTVWVRQPGRDAIFTYPPDVVARIAAAAGRPDYVVGAPRSWSGPGADLIGPTTLDPLPPFG